MLRTEINPNRNSTMRMGMSMPVEILLIWLPVTLLLTLFWSNTVRADEPTPNRDSKISTGEKVVKADKQWREELSPEVYNICREKGTERAFTGKYWNTKTRGTYACAVCGNELFSSRAKYDSGSGWPSYTAPISDENVDLKTDKSLFVTRVEIVCARCDSHLGHVFDDGPKPTGKRYCVNSAALQLVEEKKKHSTE